MNECQVSRNAKGNKVWDCAFSSARYASPCDGCPRSVPGYPWVTWATHSGTGRIQRVSKMHYARIGGETACGILLPERYDTYGPYKDYIPNHEANGDECQRCRAVVNTMAQMGAADGRP